MLPQFVSSKQHFFCFGSRCEPLQGPCKPLLDLHIEVGAMLYRLGLWIAVRDVRDQRGDLHRVVYGPLQYCRLAKSHQPVRVSLADGDAHDHPHILPWHMSDVCVYLGTRAHVATSNTCCSAMNDPCVVLLATPKTWSCWCGCSAVFDFSPNQHGGSALYFTFSRRYPAGHPAPRKRS